MIETSRGPGAQARPLPVQKEPRVIKRCIAATRRASAMDNDATADVDSRGAAPRRGHQDRAIHAIP